MIAHIITVLYFLFTSVFLAFFAYRMRDELSAADVVVALIAGWLVTPLILLLLLMYSLEDLKIMKRKEDKNV